MRIFYQSPVAYGWIRQRPHFMAEGLAAAGHQVFWFYAASFTKCRFRRWDDGHGLIGLELPVLPLASRFRPLEWLNRIWVSWWLRHLKADIVVATNPVALPWLPRHLDNVPHLYDCMDVQTAFFTGRRRRCMAEAEEKLVRKARAIIASSVVIRDKLVKDYSLAEGTVTVIPNGIEMSEDRSGVVPQETSSATPYSGKETIIAYFGTIAPWFDWNGVLDAAAGHPEWRFELYGPCDGKIPVLPENVVMKGSVSHDSVLPLAMAADVLIMPFVRSELIDGVDPVKMYEYLRAGRPIVSSWWPLLEKFTRFDAVGFYGRENSLSLSDCIAKALSGPRIFPAPESFLEANSWKSRVSTLEGAATWCHRNQKGAVE